MTPQPIPLDVRDLQSDVARLTDREKTLTAQNAALRELVERYKERERLFVRAIEHLVDTPATSVVAVKKTGKAVDVFFDTGAVWRRVTKVRDTESEFGYFEDYIAVKAVPTTRPAIVQDLNDEIAKLPLSPLFPSRVA